VLARDLAGVTGSVPRSQIRLQPSALRARPRRMATLSWTRAQTAQLGPEAIKRTPAGPVTPFVRVESREHHPREPRRDSVRLLEIISGMTSGEHRDEGRESAREFGVPAVWNQRSRHQAQWVRVVESCAVGGFAAAVALLLGSARATAQEGPFTPWVGEQGITETVEQIMQRGRFEEPSNAHEDALVTRAHAVPERRGLPQNPSAPWVSSWPSATSQLPGADHETSVPSGLHTGGPNLPQTVNTSFQMIQISESGFVPPDTQGAVGPTQVLAIANGRVKVFGKNGVLGGLNTSMDNFFNSVRNGSTTSDPQIRYDRTSGRFVATCVNTSTPNRVLFAVSSGSTITSQSSFTFFFFQQDLVAPVGNTGQFADYPKTGVDANAIYVGANMFSGNNYVGTTGWVVQKASVLGAGPIVATAFRGLAPSGSAEGPASPTGVDNWDPTATEGYFIGTSNAVFGELVVRRISNPGGTPSISGNLLINVPATDFPQLQPALGSTGTLDSLDDRLFAASLHKNRLTGTTSLWTAHNIDVNSSGVANSSGGRNGSRWYQLGNLTTTPSLTQSGTLFDSSSTNPRGFWIPSVAMSGQGHMALGSSYAGNADHAGVAVAGRLSGDPLGTIQAPTLAVVSTTNYNVQSGAGQRWGDFSVEAVDPTDDQTIWTFQEYCNANNSWATRAVQLMAPPPATPSSCNPTNVAVGASNVNVIVTGTSSNGSGFYDTEPGFNRIAANFGGTGITVNSITLNTPTQLTLNVSVSNSAPPGSQTLTVTNPDGQSTTSANGILTVGNVPPGMPFCAGDGLDPQVQVTCPCFNFGAQGNGCANSVNANGASLASTGTTSPDTVVMTANGELSMALSILLQGDVDASTGIVFGDGIRCANGNLKRLYSKNASGGTVAMPGAGDLPITLRSAALGDPILPGSTRYYHTYYRDSNLVFCPAGFNATNGQLVNW
jgi:hypothetical protein